MVAAASRSTSGMSRIVLSGNGRDMLRSSGERVDLRNRLWLEPGHDTAVTDIRAVCRRMLKEVAGRPAADLREAHRAEHRYSLFANRIVLNLALIVEDHCRPVFRLEYRPARQ